MSRSTPTVDQGVDAPADITVRRRPTLEQVGRWGMPGTLVVVVLVSALISPRFATTGNLLNVLNAAAIVGIVAFGMTVVLLVGGLVDLSVVATVAIGATVTLVAGESVPVLLAMALGVLAAAAAGAINGALIGFVGLNPVIVTLGTNVIILGFAQLIVGGAIIYTPFPDLRATLSASYLGVPFGVWMAVLVCLALQLALSFSAWGRRVYAVGGNPLAAQVAGVNARRIKAGAFVVSASLAGFAGSVLALQLGQVRPAIGAGYEFAAVTVVVVGGASLFGGAGSVVRTTGGLLLLAVVDNNLTLIGFPTLAQGMVRGAIIVVAVAIDLRLRARSTK